jgi:ABC-type phosphate/phosphonate transport system ATPase subunit
MTEASGFRGNERSRATTALQDMGFLDRSAGSADPLSGGRTIAE